MGPYLDDQAALHCTENPESGTSAQVKPLPLAQWAEFHGTVEDLTIAQLGIRGGEWLDPRGGVQVGSTTPVPDPPGLAFGFKWANVISWQSSLVQYQRSSLRSHTTVGIRLRPESTCTALEDLDEHAISGSHLDGDPDRINRKSWSGSTPHPIELWTIGH